MLARAKALALQAMIDAGGKPAWVRCAAPAAAPRPRPAGLTDEERGRFAHTSARFIASLDRVLRSLERGPLVVPLRGQEPPEGTPR
jgi:hypothetical protein